MAYIGRPSIVGNFVKLDAITAVNGQAAYTMQNNSVNFTDYSTVNQFMVSLNSVIQSPGSSFTVSGSTITFASNLVTGDVIDFIIVFGNSLSAGTPTDATVSTAKIVDSNVTTAKLADDAVTAAKINDDIISGATALTSEPADTDEFLVSDAGTLKRIDYSLIKGSGVAVSVVQDTTDYSQTNQGETVFGSGLSFTPASTTSQVMAFVEANIGITNDGSDNDARTRIKCGTDNSSGNTIFESSGTDNHGHVNMQSSGHSMYGLHTFVISNCQRNSSNNVVVKLTSNSNQDTGTTVYMYNMKAVFMEIG